MLLQVAEIDTYYGSSHTLQGVSIRVPRGTVVALIGRNGAGKSTALKSIMGRGAGGPGHDSVCRGGDPPPAAAPGRAPRHRLRAPSSAASSQSLTVDEHLALGGRRGGGGRRFPAERLYATFPELAERRRHRGSELSGGEQQMLAIARALVQEPRLLILDEPTEGLAPTIVERIDAVLRALKRDGMTMLLVEQNYPFALSLAERAYVLGKGRVRWHGAALALADHPAVTHTWLGV